MKVVLLTSTFLRHQFVANFLSERADLVGLWQEKKSFQPQALVRSEEDRKVIEGHFEARERSEDHYFRKEREVRLARGTVHRLLAAGEINEQAEVSKMADLKPDVVLVFGTGLLKDATLQAFGGRILNLHLGLSPYYRGSGTNFWPLVNCEPEYVGATVHYVNGGIDSGDIVAHVRPWIEAGDGPHDLGNKAILEAAPVLLRAAEARLEGEIRRMPQTEKGRLYQRKDFNADAVRRLYRNFESGMIEEYLKQKTERDRALKVVTLEAPHA